MLGQITGWEECVFWSADSQSPSTDYRAMLLLVQVEDELFGSFPCSPPNYCLLAPALFFVELSTDGPDPLFKEH